MKINLLRVFFFDDAFIKKLIGIWSGCVEKVFMEVRRKWFLFGLFY